MIKLLGTNFEYEVRNQYLYSDNTPFIKVEDYDNVAYFADTMILQAGDIRELFIGISMVHGIHANGGRIRKLIMPYIPCARQDRVNPTGDVLYSIYTVAQMINSCGFEVVLCADPHSHAAVKLINNLVEFPLNSILRKLNPGKDKSYDGIICPDKGAKLRAFDAQQELGGVLITATKDRDPADGRLSGFAVDVDAGKHYLVVDDIADGGGTFVGLGEKIIEQGATADLFVTHGIFSKGTSDLNNIYGRIFTTNSRMFSDRNILTKFDIITEMRNYNV